eukprot:COSAG06_NODE_9251_length_1946_cov_679.917848_2_plen_152_part_00
MLTQCNTLAPTAGDALSICFNTVAVLFLCEIDNMMFSIGLPERIRERLEVVARVELNEDETAVLAFSKPVHVIIIVISTATSVWGVGNFSHDLGMFSLLQNQILPILLGQLAEALFVGKSSFDKAKRMGGVVVHWAIGMCVTIAGFQLGTG